MVVFLLYSTNYKPFLSSLFVLYSTLFFCCYKRECWADSLGSADWGLRWVSHSHSSNIADFSGLIKASLLWIYTKGINQKCFMTESSNFFSCVSLPSCLVPSFVIQMEAVNRNTWKNSEIDVIHCSLKVRVERRMNKLYNYF
jgi:hypothetical protein